MGAAVAIREKLLLLKGIFHFQVAYKATLTIKEAQNYS